MVVSDSDVHYLKTINYIIALAHHLEYVSKGIFKSIKNQHEVQPYFISKKLCSMNTIFGNKMRLLYIFYTFKIYFVAPEYCTLGQKNLPVPDRNSNFALGYLCGGHIETFQLSLHTSKSGDLTNVCMLRKSEIIIEKLMNE